MADLAVKGLHPADLLIESVSMKSPADKAGLRGGDLLVSVDGQSLIGFEDLRSKIQKTTGIVRIGYVRANVPGFLEVEPEEQKISGQVFKTVGVYRGGEFIPPKLVDRKSLGLIGSITTASSETWEMAVKTVVGFKMLFTGKMSLKNISGPIAIGKVASDSLEVGIAYFLRLMALISINLAIINLFPIPVLDGGHILFIGVEIANRGPLSRRKIELAQQFGMSILLLLIVMALFNDLSRFL
jgi:regulator of sigma E protease